MAFIFLSPREAGGGGAEWSIEILYYRGSFASNRKYAVTQASSVIHRRHKGHVIQKSFVKKLT